MTADPTPPSAELPSSVFGLAAGYLLGERLQPRQRVGAVIIVAAAAAIAVRQRAAAPTTEPAPNL